MPPNTVTRARTRSATSRVPSAGSTCRTSRRSASGTSSRWRAARRSRARRRSPGRLLERSKGKDTTAGHWELMGVVTPTRVPDLPAGLPARRDRPVHAPHRPRRARQQGGLGHGDHPGARRGAPATGKWIVYTSADSVFQIAAHEETIPLEELYEGCRIAREILTGKHAVGRVIARPFIGEPGNYERTPNRHDFSLEPKRPNYLTLRPRGRQDRPRRRQDRRHLRRLATSTSRSRRSRTSTGSSRPRSCCASSTRG